MSLVWGRPSSGRGDVWPLPERNHLILLILSPCKSRVNKTYCEQNNPSNDYVDRLSKALLTLIAKQTTAKVFLLHFSGPSNDPVLSQLPPNVELISALPKDFD